MARTITELKGRIRLLEKELLACRLNRKFLYKVINYYRRPWWMKLLDYLEINYD